MEIESSVMRNFELPGRSLTVARKGMAATSHAAATLAAVDALRDGGNAIDAAVTACAACSPAGALSPDGQKEATGVTRPTS